MIVVDCRLSGPWDEPITAGHSALLCLVDSHAKYENCHHTTKVMWQHELKSRLFVQIVQVWVSPQRKISSHDRNKPKYCQDYSRTSIIRTSIIRISRLSGLFRWSQFGHELVTIKIRSHILFKTTALKGAVKCKGFCSQKAKAALALVGGTEEHLNEFWLD